VVLGTAVVVGVVIKRLYAPPSQAANGLASTLPDHAASTWKPPMSDTALLPAGSRITGIAASDGIFAVSVSTSQGDELWIINPSTGNRFVSLLSKP